MTLPNEPAFGHAGSEDRTGGDMPDGNYYHSPVDGLTKREWFAGMALQGILANDCGAYHFDLAAEHAIKYADALISALNEK